MIEIPEYTEPEDIDTNFIENLEEDEKIEIYITIMELADEYLTNEIIKMTEPTFLDDYYFDVTHIIFQQLLECGICNDDHYDDLYDFVKEVVTYNLETLLIPLRSEDHVINTGIIRPSVVKIRALQEQLQPAQRTPEWYAFRQSIITASNIGKIFSSEAQLNSFIYEKCKAPNMNMGSNVNTDSPLHWGVKYEPLTRMIYEYRYETNVGEFGCIVHPVHPFLAASPDGINVAEESPLFGRMVEIKNIVNRDIEGIPSTMYWVQMQIQMECCDLDECDFIETRFKEYVDAEEFYADATHSELGEKGILLHFISDIDGSPIYKYTPIGQYPDKEDSIEEWALRLDIDITVENAVFQNIIYWYLDEFSCVLVKRNKQWFQAAMPKISETWDIIQKEKNEGFEHRAPKKKNAKNSNTSSSGLLFQIDDNGESHVIQNMPVINSYMVIKTDEN